MRNPYILALQSTERNLMPDTDAQKKEIEKSAEADQQEAAQQETGIEPSPDAQKNEVQQ